MAGRGLSVTAAVSLVRSRANPLLKELRQLARDNAAYRKQGRVWIEGEHLLEAALLAGVRLQVLVLSESAALAFDKWALTAERVARVPDALWGEFSALDSPAGVGAVLQVPAHGTLQPHAPTVILDRLQDAGNVGSILRSAAAFGFAQVLALQGCAALWSAKVLRSAMGAHFSLRLQEGLLEADLQALRVPVLVTSSHQGRWLHQQTLPWPCAWAFGHEGQGVGAALRGVAERAVRIVQPAGQESINVAAAAAICLHASAAQTLVAGSGEAHGSL